MKARLVLIADFSPQIYCPFQFSSRTPPTPTPSSLERQEIITVEFSNITALLLFSDCRRISNCTRTDCKYSISCSNPLLFLQRDIPSSTASIVLLGLLSLHTLASRPHALRRLSTPCLLVWEGLRKLELLVSPSWSSGHLWTKEPHLNAL